MYGKILVSLDGSKQSECIIDHVLAIAKGCDMPEVVLIRVVEPFPTAATNYVGEDSAREVQKKSVAAAEEYLSYVADPLRSHCGGVELVVREGNPADEILDYATHSGVDLIAMSTRGESGITRWATGSVTRRVMEHWAGPLLTVPPTHK